MTPESLRPDQTTDQTAETSENVELGEVEDIMIQDPWCKVYFPMKSSVTLVVDGKELRFCSEACRDAYINK